MAYIGTENPDRPFHLSGQPEPEASFSVEEHRSVQDCVSEWLLYLSSVRALSTHTVAGYREDMRHLCELVGGERYIEDISLEDLRTCIGSLSRRKYSSASVNRFVAAVRGLFSYCKKFCLVKKNVALELKTVKNPKHLPRFMTRAEVDALCAQPQKKELLWESRDRAIFELFYSSGCRVGELASLRFQDFSAGYESAVVTGKGKKDRWVYFGRDAVESLKTYLAERNSRFPESSPNGAFAVDNVFVNQRGTALTEHGIWYIVKRYSGVEGTNKPVSPHAFRHTFATVMLTEGADIRVVQEMLGHASISTTQRYTHLSTQALKEIYNQAFPHSGN